MATEIPPITATAVTAIPRLYPHVEQVADWSASQSLRLAWDRIHDLEERLQATEATQAMLVQTVNAVIAALAQVEVLAEQAYAKTQQP